MSIFGALSTAVSGLSAQSHAFTDISNNISNSQTVGYKATDTNFSDYVLTSGDAQGTNGTVRATTAAENEAQGTITSTTNALALAISGRGFFSVDEESGNSTAVAKNFQSTDYYTRNGDFTQDNLGYLVNSSDQYLNGYMVDPTTGTLNTSSLQTINVSGVTFKPVATTTVTDAASLPSASSIADSTSTAGSTSQTTSVYNSAGGKHSLNLDWTYGSTDSSGNSTWTVAATLDSASSSSMSASVTFDSSGALSSITPSGGSATSTPGTTASFTIPASSSTSAITVNLGSIGSTSGTTMATGTATGSVGSATADGVNTGVFQGITMTSDGNIMANFDNDHTQLVAKIPLAMFADANGLLAQDGQAYTATSASGTADVTLSGENGAGNLETSSVENSTTSLDTDLTKLITAQQAYGANAKVVTTANEMLQTVLSLKQ